MPRTNLVNALDTVLVTGVAAGAITLSVADGARIPAAPFYVVVNPFSSTEREYMLCSAVTPSSGDLRTLTVTRNEDGSVGDVAHAAGDLVRFVTVAQHISDLWDQVELTASERVRWKFPYIPGGPFETNDMVRDGVWTMIANADTVDRAAPQPVGDEFDLYDGAAPTTALLASQIIFGNRYAASVDGYLNDIRIYTVIGNHYLLYVVRDPLGEKIFELLRNFTAVATGWQSFSTPQLIVPEGVVFDIIAIVNEPDPTPTTFSANWDYRTPQNIQAPIDGQIQHARAQPDQIRISKVDSDANDVSASLATLNVGDKIEALGVQWVIQLILDQGTYVTYSVAPALTASPEGVTEFMFETVTATPITVMVDTDWWLTSQTPQNQGLAIVDGDYDSIVPNDTAYGTDITVQAASVSPDWDAVAYGGN